MDLNPVYASDHPWVIDSGLARWSDLINSAKTNCARMETSKEREGATKTLQEIENDFYRTIVSNAPMGRQYMRLLMLSSHAFAEAFSTLPTELGLVDFRSFPMPKIEFVDYSKFNRRIK